MAAATNTEVLANYREQKKTLEGLAIKARKQMQVRFTELLAEAASIMADYKTDFGVNPDVPATVKTFTLSDGKKKTTEPVPATPAVTANGPKIGGLRRSLAAAIKNDDAAKIAEVTAQLAAFGVDVTAVADNPVSEPEPEPAEDDTEGSINDEPEF